MAEKNIDKLLGMTDSKYRLSVVIAKRAIQLKSGINSVLSPENRIGTRNLVTLAMRETATGKLKIGEDLVNEHKLQSYLDRTRQQQQEQIAAQSAGNYTMPDFDE